MPYAILQHFICSSCGLNYRHGYICMIIIFHYFSPSPPPSLPLSRSLNAFNLFSFLWAQMRTVLRFGCILCERNLFPWHFFYAGLFFQLFLLFCIFFEWTFFSCSFKWIGFISTLGQMVFFSSLLYTFLLVWFFPSWLSILTSRGLFQFVYVHLFFLSLLLCAFSTVPLRFPQIFFPSPPLSFIGQRFTSPKT